MKTKSLLIVLTAALSPFAVAKNAKSEAATKNQENVTLMMKALKVKVGSSTRADVVRLLGQPWRSTNDADCQATEYGEVWEYLAEDANGVFRIHIAFNQDGTASLVARIPQHGDAVVLAFTAGKPTHRH